MDLETAETATLYPDRRPAYALAAVVAAIVAIGAWLAVRSGPIGLVAVGVGVAVLIGCAAWLVPSRSFLHLTGGGFIYSTRFNPRRVDWRDVARFGVVTIDGEPRVVWDYAPHYPADATDRERTRARTGFEAVLPRCCRMKGEPLAALMDRRRLRAGSGGPPGR